MKSGPLAGTTVIELGGIGPGPFAGMLMADLGADVIRIDRSAGQSELFPGDPTLDLLNRGKRSAILDLKDREAVRALMTVVGKADVLIEDFGRVWPSGSASARKTAGHTTPCWSTDG